MHLTGDFVELVNKFRSVADFVTIYIKEARAKDEWNFRGNAYKICAHTNLEERLTAARVLKGTGCVNDIYVDGITDDMRYAYGASPERLVILCNDVVQYEGALGPFGYKIGEVQKWLEDYNSHKKYT